MIICWVPTESTKKCERAYPLPEESFQQLSHKGGQHTLLRVRWTGFVMTGVARRPVVPDLPWDGTGRWWQEEEQNGLCSVYLNYIPFTELIKHRVSFHLLWNLKTLACPLHQSTAFKPAILVEALSHTGDSPTATPQSPWCACNLWALSHSPRERTHVSHGKQREQDTE